MNRRETLIGLFAFGNAALGWPLVGHAQEQAKKIPRIGVLWHAGSAEEEQPFFGAFIEGLAELGYIDGRNIILEHRYANEMPDRFKSMAAELVSSNVDVLVGVGGKTSKVVKDATTTIPVVFVFAIDPVGDRLVESLGHPGGNVTGLPSATAGLVGKRLQLLRELIPKLSRVALLVNPDEGVRLFIGEAHEAAATLKLKLQVFEARSPAEIEPAINAMVTARMQGLTLYNGGLYYQQRALIADLANARRLPTSLVGIDFVKAGALMGYGNNGAAIIRKAGRLLDKILKGAKPADIPVELPTVFQFVINLKTAKTLGLKIPQSILLRADQVIE